MIQRPNLIAIYAAIVILSGIYLFAIEGVTDGTFYVHGGGRDYVFSFYDLTLFFVLFVSFALTIISLMAYNRKKSDRLFFVSFAFFLFTIKAALKLVDNFVLGGYSYIGISIQTLEFLILLSLFYAIFKK